MFKKIVGIAIIIIAAYIVINFVVGVGLGIAAIACM